MLEGIWIGPWKNVETQLELFWTHGSAVYLGQKTMDYDQHKTIPRVKHGGGQVLIQCFAAAGSVNLDCMKDIVHSLRYEAILAENVMPFVQRLMVLLQWDDDTKYTSNLTKTGLEIGPSLCLQI
jgi:hypothetical protein